jgi:hypothetical protein
MKKILFWLSLLFVSSLFITGCLNGNGSGGNTGGGGGPDPVDNPPVISYPVNTVLGIDVNLDPLKNVTAEDDED